MEPSEYPNLSYEYNIRMELKEIKGVGADCLDLTQNSARWGTCQYFSTQMGSMKLWKFLSI